MTNEIHVFVLLSLRCYKPLVLSLKDKTLFCVTFLVLEIKVFRGMKTEMYA